MTKPEPDSHALAVEDKQQQNPFQTIGSREGLAALLSRRREGADPRPSAERYSSSSAETVDIIALAVSH